MKTKEEIDELYHKLYSISIDGEDNLHYYSFVDGYNKCQEDVIELLKEEIKSAFIHGQGNAQMMEAGLERDEVEEYSNWRMLSIKK